MDKIEVDNKYFGLVHGISVMELNIYGLLELISKMNNELNINTLLLQRSGDIFYVKVDDITTKYYQEFNKQ